MAGVLGNEGIRALAVFLASDESNGLDVLKFSWWMTEQEVPLYAVTDADSFTTDDSLDELLNALAAKARRGNGLLQLTITYKEHDVKMKDAAEWHARYLNTNKSEGDECNYFAEPAHEVTVAVLVDGKRRVKTGAERAAEHTAVAERAVSSLCADPIAVRVDDGLTGRNVRRSTKCRSAECKRPLIYLPIQPLR